MSHYYMLDSIRTVVQEVSWDPQGAAIAAPPDYRLPEVFTLVGICVLPGDGFLAGTSSEKRCLA